MKKLTIFLLKFNSVEFMDIVSSKSAPEFHDMEDGPREEVAALALPMSTSCGEFWPKGWGGQVQVWGEAALALPWQQLQTGRGSGVPGLPEDAGDGGEALPPSVGCAGRKTTVATTLHVEGPGMTSFGPLAT